MNLLLIAFIVYLCLILVGFIMIKNIFKAVLMAGLVFSLVAILLGIFIFLDMQDIKKNAKEEVKVFLTHDNTLIAGFVSAGEESTVLFEKDLELLNEDYILNDYQAMLGKSYRLNIFSSEIVESLGDFTLVVLATKFTDDQVIAIFENDGVAETWKEELFLTDISVLRALLFSELIGQQLSGNDQALTTMQFLQDDLLIVYPESISYRLLDSVPVSVAEKFVI